MRSRPGKGWPFAVVSGIASAAASDTIPRTPVRPMTITCAASAQIGTKIWEFRSCSETNIPLRLIGCYNSALRDRFSAAQCSVSSELDGMRRCFFEVLRKPSKAKLSALVGRRRGPSASAINREGLTLNQLRFRYAEGCDIQLSVPINYCTYEIKRNRSKKAINRRIPLFLLCLKCCNHVVCGDTDQPHIKAKYEASAS
jgi:hypothetical protein